MPYDLFALTETNLSPDIVNSELFTSNFIVYRKDILAKNPCNESASIGRGVLLAIDSKFDSSAISIPNTSNLELICIKINLTKRCMFVLCCYIPPTQPVVVYSNFADAIDYLDNLSNPEDDIIVLGDFNLPRLSWCVSADEISSVPNNATSEKEILFTDRLQASGLFQMSNIKNNL